MISLFLFLFLLFFRVEIIPFARRSRLDDSNIAQKERGKARWFRIRRLNTLLAAMYRRCTGMERRYYLVARNVSARIGRKFLCCAPLNVPPAARI